MRKYSSSVSSLPRIEYGIDLLAGLNAFAETRPLAEPLARVNTELRTGYEARLATRAPLLGARAALRIAEYSAEATIRTFSRAVEIAEKGRRGPLHAALFPDGLTPVVAAFGTRQVAPLKALVVRLVECREPEAEAVRSQWQPKLERALGSLEAAVSAHATASAAHVAALRTEVALRREHERVVDRLIGQVRGTFPRNRAAQDAVFPVLPARRAGRDEDDDLAPAAPLSPGVSADVG